MKVKPVVARELTTHDIDEISAYYPGKLAEPVTYGFIDALENAYTHTGRHSATGSLRYVRELNLPDRRFWPIKRYAHLVFCVERLDHTDGCRVLYGARDMLYWVVKVDDI